MGMGESVCVCILHVYAAYCIQANKWLQLWKLYSYLNTFKIWLPAVLDLLFKFNDTFFWKSTFFYICLFSNQMVFPNIKNGNCFICGHGYEHNNGLQRNGLKSRTFKAIVIGQQIPGSIVGSRVVFWERSADMWVSWFCYERETELVLNNHSFLR